MTNQEGNNAVVARHLEALANAAKAYTLAELANISGGGASYADATTVSSGLMSAADKAKLDGLTNYTLPTASASTKGGVKIGDGLQMDGDTLNVTLQSGSSGGGYIIGSNVSSVEGGFWQDIINDTPVLKLRHGDYEYNFQYDDLTFLGGASSPLVTVTPDTYILGTASVSGEGGVWYEVNNNVPQLKLHAGNYNYGFKYDSITYKGGNSHLVVYLPFDVSPTADACGNTWTPTGSPTIVDGTCSLNGSSYLTNSTILDTFIVNEPWTVDFWLTLEGGNYVLQLGLTNNAILYLFYFSDLKQVGLYEPSTLNTGGQSIIEKDTRHHYAITFDGSIIRLFVDGVLNAEKAYSHTLRRDMTVGQTITGKYERFRVFKGQALWTQDFTLPSASDYL